MAAKFKEIWHIKPAREEGGKGFWTKIGIAWINKDGSLNCKFDLVPTDMDNIQIRDYAAREGRGQSFED